MSKKRVGYNGPISLSSEGLIITRQTNQMVEVFLNPFDDPECHVFIWLPRNQVTIEDGYFIGEHECIWVEGDIDNEKM